MRWGNKQPPELSTPYPQNGLMRRIMAGYSHNDTRPPPAQRTDVSLLDDRLLDAV